MSDFTGKLLMFETVMQDYGFQHGMVKYGEDNVAHLVRDLAAQLAAAQHRATVLEAALRDDVELLEHVLEINKHTQEQIGSGPGGAECFYMTIKLAGAIIVRSRAALHAPPIPAEGKT